MLYMLLICYDPTIPPDPSEPKSLQLEHARVEAELRAEGRYVSGAALMPVTLAASVRLVDGRAITTDGPFAETKEAVGGYYIVDCTGREEAAACAARIPVGKNAWIQVRQIALFHPDTAKIATVSGQALGAAPYQNPFRRDDDCMKLFRRNHASSAEAIAAPRAPAAAMRGAPPAVVVELFTSQGCSSCPPADALLSRIGEIAPGTALVPLAFHVDYWDHLGWRDPFAQAAWTQRQRRYAVAFGLRAMYTPQAVVEGRTECVGSDERKLRRLIEAPAPAEGAARSIDLSVAVGGGAVEVRADVAGIDGDAADSALVVVLFESGLSTDVLRGENAGRTLAADYVVRALEERPLSALASGYDVQFTSRDGWDLSNCGVAAFVQDRRTMVISTASRQLLS